MLHPGLESGTVFYMTTTIPNPDGSPTDYIMTMGQFIESIPAEVQSVNKETHTFDYEQDRCMNCDCRPWGVWSVWPCNAEPPTHVAPWA